MVGTTGTLPKLVTAAVAIAITAITVHVVRKKKKKKKKRTGMESKVLELEKSLKAAMEKCASERQGRIRSQQALRKALLQPKSDNLSPTSYPIRPIGTIQSCFSTRNGTPRQPLLVPLARACSVFDQVRVPPASLEGLEEYSHCWVIYVFHLNTDLEKLWMEPSKSKFKAKVRVPRLKGGKKGVFATRSPHRPNPIGLTVAKVEAVQGHMLLLSGVDLVDGTPVLDVKPYLPYCDTVQEASVPEWVQEDKLLAATSVTFSEDFFSALTGCWEKVGKNTLYSSPEEIKRLIKQVLSWDIRSASQRNRPHKSLFTSDNARAVDNTTGAEDYESEGNAGLEIDYHLILEGLDICYRIDSQANAIVKTIAPAFGVSTSDRNRCSSAMWKGRGIRVENSSVET